MSIEHNGLDDIFAAAVEIADAGQREGYLRRVMAGDAAGLAELQGLVRDYFAAGSLLDRPAVVNPTFDHSRAASVGSQIGPYKLVEQIGEGGMGVVYLALQKEPIRRLVALKIIKPGMDSRQVVARFAAERQALAMMNHPHIAKVLDAGATESGNPYFVMELVRGIPITDFCDQHKLDLRQRLELFVKVCGAVQHAHQKGVIHRDLKPSNVLVELEDVKGVPKVIDFGVAKATQQPLTDGSLVTGFAQMIGTPMYMSPEQAQLNSLDVDTRSDIYSLGVLLYELLIGTTPFDKASLDQAGLDDMRRIICEQEPSLPSHKISTLEPQLLSTVSSRRQMDPRQLSFSMQRELDWIVMKTLEKDRCRRYETPNELAADILRHLHGEPVTACPPSWTYRCGKLIRRHKTAMVTAGLVSIALVLGTVASVWQARQAQAAAAAAKVAQEEAQAERDAAQRQRKYAQAIADFVQNDFLALTSVEGQDRFGDDGNETLSKDTTLRELLDRAADKLKARTDLDPRTEADLDWMIGENYRGVGEFERAVQLLEKSVVLRRRELGPDHAVTHDAENSLGQAYGAAGKTKEAITLHEQVRDSRVSKLGADHPDTLTTLHNLAEAYRQAERLSQAITLLEQVRDARVTKLGADHPDTLATLHSLAGAYLDVQDVHDEVRHNVYGEATLHSLAGAHLDAGGRLEAITLLERVRDARVMQLGPDHRDTLNTLNSLAGAYLSAGRLPEAIMLFEQIRDAVVNKLGANHPYTLIALHNLAFSYQTVGKLTEAIAIFEQVRDAQVTKLGADHPDTLNTLNSLAEAYKAAGKLPEAIALLEQVRDGRVTQLGTDHSHTLGTLSSLAYAYRDIGKLPEAIAIFEQVRDVRVTKLGADHPDTLSTQDSLADANRLAEMLPEFIKLLERERDDLMTKLGADHPDTLTTLYGLAMAYRAGGRLPEALLLAEQAATGVEKLGFQHDYAGEIIPYVIQALEEANRPDEAEAWQRKWLAAGNESAADNESAAEEESLPVLPLERFASDDDKLVTPRMPVFGPDGTGDGIADLYVVSAGTHSIVRFDGVTGARVDVVVPSQGGGLSNPVDLAFDDRHNMYVTSMGTGEVIRYPYDSGTSSWLEGASVVSGLARPLGVTFHDGNLYIANQDADEILRYDTVGETLTTFVSAGLGGLHHPRKGVFGPDGHFYVANRRADGQVLRFDGRTGEFLDSFATNPSGMNVACLEFAHDGFLYTTARTTLDSLKTSIVRFDAATGDFVDSSPLGRDGWSFTIGPDDHVYVSGNAEGSFVDRVALAAIADFQVNLNSAAHD